MSKDFKRQDSHRHLKLGTSWRRPRGTHSKMRRCRKNYPPVVSIGYRKEKNKRNKLNNGLIPVLVHNEKELLSLGKNCVAIFAKIGAKKKLEMLKIAQEKNIKVLNVGGAK